MNVIDAAATETQQLRSLVNGDRGRGLVMIKKADRDDGENLDRYSDQVNFLNSLRWSELYGTDSYKVLRLLSQTEKKPQDLADSESTTPLKIEMIAVKPAVACKAVTGRNS